MTTENDILVALSEERERALAEGEARGEARGRAEGKAEEKKAIAKSLLAKGMSVKDIVEITGVSAEMFS